MKSVNYALRKAYTTSLNGLTVNSVPVPVYYLQAPESETGSSYIVFNNISNVDAGSFSKSNTLTSMQLQINTWSESANSGKQADDIAAAVYAIIYPTPQSVLDLSADSLQMVGTFLTDDRVLEERIGNRDFVIRILTFRHNINHK